MSLATPSESMQQYLQAWAEALAGLLKERSGAEFSPEVLPPEEIPVLQVLVGNGVWMRIAAGKSLAGEQGFLISQADAARLAQIQKGEPTESKAAFAEEDGPALSGFFTRLADAVAASLKTKLGSEYEFRVAGSEKPGWTAAVKSGLRLTSAGGPPLLMFLQLDPQLTALLGGAASRSEQPAAGPRPTAPAATPAPAPAAPPAWVPDNLDLLLDVTLDATLRFGESQMRLKDILNLHSGSVVELGRQIADPVDLVVAGKVIARGEVVVVEGNYGLRAKEIASLEQRMDSLTG